MAKPLLSKYEGLELSDDKSLQPLDVVRSGNQIRVILHSTGEIVGAIVLLPIAFCLPVPLGVHFALVASVLFVLVAELLNTAIEVVVDRISSERHALSKKAKDIGSAAVLLSLINAAIIWAWVCGRYLF